MKRNEIERILKGGTVRQKIKLYLTDIALCNVDFNNLDFEIRGEELNIKGTNLLTNAERDLLWRSIKEPKDVEYYENLRRLNAVFLFFKERFTVDLTKLQAVYYLIAISYGETNEREKSRDLVNELLDLYPDKKTREKALKKAIEFTKGDGGKEYNLTGQLKYLEIDRALYWEEIKKPLTIAIQLSKGCKQSIQVFNRILSQELPLQPYKDWVKKEEQSLKTVIKGIYDITTDLEDFPPYFDKIELYQDVVAEVREEDIEDFKNSQL